ncbi:MAG: hypothetical protein ACM31O_03325 [Bacteroidota bacterium]|jgi:hypothetical protein
MCGIERCSIASVFALLGFLVAILAGTSAQAVTFGFNRITNNGNPDVGSQLFVDVTNAGSGNVSFAFRNVGSISSSITDIYFDDDHSILKLTSPAPTIFNGTGVLFSAGASPPNLPSGNDVGFTASFGADSDSPTEANGVNLSETLAIVFALAGSNTLDSVVGALFAGTLRIGLHVQSINGGGSDSYISQTPLPGALPLFVSGLAGLGFFRWFKRKKLAAA